MATIRDETGEPVSGVRPAKALAWAIRPWNVEELSEFSEFVIVQGELNFKREEGRILDSGGCQLNPKGIDSYTYRTPDDALIGVFDVGRARDKALNKRGGSRFPRFRAPFLRLEYTFNLNVDMTHDACRMQAFAQLAIERRKHGLSGSALQEASDRIHRNAELAFYKRTFLSPTCWARMLIVLVSQFLRIPGAVLRGIFYLRAQDSLEQNGASAPAHGTDSDNTPETKNEGGQPRPTVTEPAHEPAVQDVSGVPLFGVDPARIVRQVLRIWRPEDRRFLTEIILVGDDASRKSVEADLLKRRAKPLHPMQGQCRTYTSKTEGAIAVIDLTKPRDAALKYIEVQRMNWLRTGYARWSYKTHLRSTYVRDLPVALAWARATTEMGAVARSRKQVEERKDKLFFGPLAKVAMKRVRYWRTLANVVMLLALRRVRLRIGPKSANSPDDAKG